MVGKSGEGPRVRPIDGEPRRVSLVIRSGSIANGLLRQSLARMVVLLVVLAGPVLGDDQSRVHLSIEAFPHCEVYLDTVRGPSFLGNSGKTLVVEPPILYDQQGRFSQFGPGTLVLKRAGHQDLRVSVVAQDWSRQRLPTDGQYRLVPLTFMVGMGDYLTEYRWTSSLLILLLVGTSLAARRAHAELRNRRSEMKDLSARLNVSGDPLIGKNLGEYQVVDRLGSGGMATVYKVQSGGKFFAAKVLYVAATDKDNLQRFRREFKLLSGLNHPGLVRGFDYGESEGCAYCVMELVDGRGLDRLVTPGGLPWQTIWPWVKALMEALGHAHDQGIVHRDLKPSNVMLTQAGPKILDFGLARHSSLAALTATGNAFGTPSYIAPEQISAKGAEVEPRTDQYSLGIMLFEMLTGQLPFSSPEIQDIITMHISKIPPKVSSLRGDIPVGLDEIIAKMLAKLPDLRYQSMQEVLKACQQLDLYAAPVSAVARSETIEDKVVQAQLEPTVAVVRKAVQPTPPTDGP